MKLWDIVHGRKLFHGIILDAYVVKYIPNWSSNIPPPGHAEQRVSTKIEKDKYLFGQRHGHVPRESTAVEVTRFYREMIVHYNENLNFRQVYLLIFTYCSSDILFYLILIYSFNYSRGLRRVISAKLLMLFLMVLVLFWGVHVLMFGILHLKKVQL